MKVDVSPRLVNDSVTIKNIERAIIDKAFAEGWVSPQIPTQRTGKKVAIIGSGPAGLSCASILNQYGHTVTVYERADRIGGLLTYGIPKMKIEQYVVDRRINLLKEEGIGFVPNTEVGKQISIDQLRSENDAVVLCIGATRPRDLSVPGRELSGIHFAMDYLHLNTKSLLDSDLADGKFISAEGKDVIVIGGGDTATDCVSTAIRQNCKSLVQFDIYPIRPTERADNNPWPQYPIIHKVDTGQEEAISVFGQDPREFATTALEFIGDKDGNVEGVKSAKVKTSINEKGQKIRETVPGTEQSWSAQLVLLAIGFEGPETEMLNNTNITVNHRSNIEVKTGTHHTYEEGIFTAGDARTGASLIVWAIQEGKEAAKECHDYIMGDLVKVGGIKMLEIDYIQQLFADRIGGSQFGLKDEIYKFEKIKRAKREAVKKNPGKTLIDLGVGEPDAMADERVVRKLAEEAKRAENRFYADNGILEFQQAAATYMKEVFGVDDLNPETEINHVIGSKSALAMLPTAFINPGDMTIMPTPNYPILGTHTKYLGGDVVHLPLLEENSFLPRLDSLSHHVLKKSKLLYLNYPNNPTGALANKEFFEEVVHFAKKHELIVVHDAAYAALVFDDEKPLSFLSVPGAKEVGIELHSLSKSFNMTGWRIGFIAGNEKLVSAFGAVKDNCDSGQFIPIQKAASYALSHPEITERTAEKYSRRHATLAAILREGGFMQQTKRVLFLIYKDS